ncbi:hypothetical protein JAAARDRAFT_33406 [Jaapia argillacea MUCL 33604]|uniref:AIG1-type G domain-containing protein n=1 Tax=Jaapia argillacea MUCL 33604 TaxID=933084 RepID=A0A067PYD8_9AGAM|nr:hypothetical protein JAAARDRAFT_33406 [Jaapia argillacea MUCL 33604]
MSSYSPPPSFEELYPPAPSRQRYGSHQQSRSRHGGPHHESISSRGPNITRLQALPPAPPPFSSQTTLVPTPYTPASYAGSDSIFPSIPTANVIVFGESGAGKSSVINMVAGRDVANTSSGATGCTFRSEQHVVSTPHVTMNIFDTVGLNEGSEGTVQSADAIKNLYKLVRSMEDGVNLLVYVVKGPRIKESTSNNYRMFYEAFCQKKVPIVLVITGLENESDPDDWWRKNFVTFRKYRMEFSGQACVTATRGKQNSQGRCVFQKEYDDSVPKVVDLITQRCSGEPFKMERIGWFLAVLKTTFNGVTIIIPGVKPAVLARALYLALCQAGGMPPEKAKKLANEVERELLLKDFNGDTPVEAGSDGDTLRIVNEFDKAFLSDGYSMDEVVVDKRHSFLGIRWGRRKDAGMA